MKNLIYRAQKTLLANRKKGYTLPTNSKLYPAQWNWDSAFIALGYSYFNFNFAIKEIKTCLLYTSPSPRDQRGSRMPSSA